MLGIISDIHGNIEALRAAVDAGDRIGVDEWVCLGDVVGYGASPNECVALVAERCRIVLLGNHDEAASSNEPPDRFNALAADAILWTRDALRRRWRRYLASRPLRADTEHATYVHASPDDPGAWRYLLTHEDAGECAAHMPTSLCFIGHTHQPGVFTFAGPGAPRRIINVGSVGQPRDGDPRACVAIMRPGEGFEGVELVRVAYDVEAARRKILRAGLPEVLAQRLVAGM